METGNRYADKVYWGMNDRIARCILKSDPPVSLGREELELDVQPETRTPPPPEARTYVRYPDGPVQVVVRTVRAVAVRWPTREDEHREWVWWSAVEIVL